MSDACYVGQLLAATAGFYPTDQPFPVITADPNKPDSVAEQFVSALVRKDWEMAKAASAPSLWPRIEHWFTARRILQTCKSVGINDFDGFRVTRLQHVETPAGVLLYSGHYRCFDSNYDLLADEVQLKKFPDGYKVIDWKSIEATYPKPGAMDLPRFRWVTPPATASRDHQTHQIW